MPQPPLIGRRVHLRDMTVTGPHNPTGVSETVSRKKILRVPVSMLSTTSFA